MNNNHKIPLIISGILVVTILLMTIVMLLIDNTGTKYNVVLGLLILLLGGSVGFSLGQLFSDSLKA